MKRIAHEFLCPGARAGGVTALLVALALACPWPAVAGDPATAPGTSTRPAAAVAPTGSTQAVAATEQAPVPTRAVKTTAAKPDSVQAHINDLHTKLKISPEQEEQWQKVTEVMRENASRMEEVSKARAEKAKAMTAVEDLKAYGEITDVHAEGIKRFVAAFEPLYNSMSDAQKHNADDLFLHRIAGRTPLTSKPVRSSSKTN